MRELVQRPRGQPVRTTSAQRLPGQLSQRMQAATGQDFSNVRVHIDSTLPSPAMRAFTCGDDVHFAPGQYAPHTSTGQQLIGHELTHVTQQRSGRAGGTPHDGPSIQFEPGLEREADRLGGQMARGTGVSATQPMPASRAANRASIPVIQGYWVKAPGGPWTGTDFDAQDDLQKNFNDRQREERAAELASLRTGVGQSGTRPSAVRADPNNTTRATQILSRHLVRSGRASQRGSKKELVTNVQVAAAQQAEADKTGKDLTSRQRQQVHPLAQQHTGGPNEAKKNEKMREILQRMESATNQSYVANALYEKNKRTQPNLKLHESLNATHAKLKHSDYKGDAAKLAAAEKLSVKSSHFYGRHGAQISKADQLARVGANVAPDKKLGRVGANVAPDNKPAPMPVTAVDVPDPTQPGATVAVPDYHTTGDDDALGKASGGFASHAANIYAIEEALAQSWHRPSPATQTARHTYEVTDETGGGPPTVTTTDIDKELHPQKQLDVDVNLPVPGGTAMARLFPGGFGTSYLHTSALTKNSPIGPGAIRARLASPDLTAHTDQQSAHVILQQDSERGGFAVHTAYPQRPPRGVQPGDPTTVQRGYVATDLVPRSHKIGNKASGAVAYVPKDKKGNFASIEGGAPNPPPLQPFARSFELQPPAPSDTGSEKNLQERLQRIHETGLTHQANTTDPTKPRVLAEKIADSDAIKDMERSLRRKKRKVQAKTV